MPRLIADMLIAIDSKWDEQILLSEAPLKNMDAVIATGSDNSAMYFESYFGKYPHIIRKNRSSLAVLDGSETEGTLRQLGADIFTFYGLGCRNVSKVYVPEGYDFTSFFEAIFPLGSVIDHPKYCNNYEYNRAVYLLNNLDFLDNNFLLVKEDKQPSSPIGVLFFEYYNSEEELTNRLDEQENQTQVIVSNREEHTPFGAAQQPGVNDYADRVDTMAFLAEL